LTNNQRIADAHECLVLTDGSAHRVDTDGETAVAHLLDTLRHYCAAHKIDFYRAAARSQDAFTEQRKFGPDEHC
jgi:hypothetical protein